MMERGEYNLVYLPEVCFLIKIWYGFETACNQEEVMELAKSAQKTWAKTPLWKRAELLHKAAAILKEHKAPIAECLIKEIAKPAKDSVTEVFKYFPFSRLNLNMHINHKKGVIYLIFLFEWMKVVRSGDLISYTAEEGVRILGEGKFLVSDSFPGNERTKYCLTSKVYFLAHIH
jgi:glyceraldehyde-3-phosphate dehydrogenase (NADP+)